MIKFVKSEMMKINVYEEQKCFLSNKNRMEEAIKRDDVLTFDIYNDTELVGFAMLQQFKKDSFFLWNYAIYYKYQNKGLGVNALNELINLLKEKYNMKIMTTTYTYGNWVAKKLYEKIGFVQTDIVCNDECHEVNMIYKV